MKRNFGYILLVTALVSTLVARAQSPDPTTTPLPTSAVPDFNTSAPAANASVMTVVPPEALTSSSELQNGTFSSIGFEDGTTATQFNASIPLQTDNATVAALETFNTSVASLLPENATQVISENDNSTLLIADPSWGREIVVQAASLNSTQLVVSNATDLGSTTAFTTVYNTTTVVHNDDTEAYPWQHSVCTATFQEQSMWQDSAVGNSTYNASVKLIVRSTVVDDTVVPWTLSLASAGGYIDAESTYGLVNVTVANGTVTGQVVGADQTLVAQAGNAPNFDLIVASSFIDFQPVAITVNGNSCAIIIDSNVTMEPLPNITSSPTGGAATESAAGLTTRNGQITDLDGNVLVFKGLNWFGFDDGNTGPDGLWAGSTSMTLDYANIMLRIKALGFNAVRLPFSFKDLKRTMKPFGRSCSFVSGNTLAASTIPRGTTVAPGSSFPSLSEPPQSTQTLGVCSAYLDVGTTFNRLVYVVRLLTHNGFYVMLDNQFNLDTSVLDNQNQWLSDWTNLLKAVAKDPISRSRLMVDVLNEPDVFGVRWEAANGKPGYADLCIKLMDAAYSIVPDALFLVEGTAQSGLAYNWGDGMGSTSAALKQFRGISDAGVFFEQVMSKPYLNQVVAAPHVYPPSITKARDKYTGSALFSRLSMSFGYLNKQGYCSRSNPSNCHRFPVMIGETGTNFESQADRQQMADFALYLNNQGAGNDGQHNAIPSWFWWAWNANSGDTGGIVEDDWSTINWNKVNFLVGIGLQPWYKAQSTTPAARSSGGCGDVPPDKKYTCAQQAAWGKCNEAYMLKGGFCKNTCGRCNTAAPAVPSASCTDTPPNKQHTCAQQVAWGKCNEAFMSGYCNKSCKRCSAAATCSDNPPNSQYTCAQQAGWGKCNDQFMTTNNYCQITCGRCSSCSDKRPDTKYTCAQQAGFGKCSESWMVSGGFCKKSCGRC